MIFDTRQNISCACPVTFSRFIQLFSLRSKNFCNGSQPNELQEEKVHGWWKACDDVFASKFCAAKQVFKLQGIESLCASLEVCRMFKAFLGKHWEIAWNLLIYWAFWYWSFLLLKGLLFEESFSLWISLFVVKCFLYSFHVQKLESQKPSYLCKMLFKMKKLYNFEKAFDFEKDF